MLPSSRVRSGAGRVWLQPPVVSALFTAPALCRALGKAYSLGRAEYGRLGLGEGAEEKSTPTVIPDLPSISSVACGASVGYAVSSDGECWGLPAMGGFWSCPVPFQPLILLSKGSAQPIPSQSSITRQVGTQPIARIAAAPR